jgi:hypothetical protein
MAAFAIRLAFGALLCLVPPAALAETAGPAASGQNALDQQQLQQLVAPIALYPDDLLAQLLMASTYPLEVVEAERWSQSHSNLTGGALQQAMQQEPWDPSVKSLAAFPQVLKMMNDQLDWTQKLGDAFLSQQQDVMQAVQTLREKAQGTGTLKTTSQQTVSSVQPGAAPGSSMSNSMSGAASGSTSGSKTYVTIQPSNPQTVYVPSYNPATAYGAWPYPALPPYSFGAQPASYWPGGGAIGFGAGIAAGSALWGACNWPHGGVGINTGNFNNFNNTNIVNPDWRHNPDHRHGVPYPNHNLARQYGRGDLNQAARNEFRGRMNSGQPLFSNHSPYPGGQPFAHEGQFPNHMNPNGLQNHALEGLGRGDDVHRHSERGRQSRAQSFNRQSLNHQALNRQSLNRQSFNHGRQFAPHSRPQHSSAGRRMGGMRFAGHRGRSGGRRR